MKEFLYYNDLFDLYGSLLTEKEQNAFQDYYQEDLSLGEIAELKSISRSAVSKTIKTVLDKLNYYENHLLLYKKKQMLQEACSLKEIEKIKRAIEEVLSL